MTLLLLLTTSLALLLEHLTETSTISILTLSEVQKTATAVSAGGVKFIPKKLPNDPEIVTYIEKMNFLVIFCIYTSIIRNLLFEFL